MKRFVNVFLLYISLVYLRLSPYLKKRTTRHSFGLLPRYLWSSSRSLLLKIEIQFPLNNFNLLWPIDTKLGACNQNNGIIFASLPSFISYSCHINTCPLSVFMWIDLTFFLNYNLDSNNTIMFVTVKCFIVDLLFVWIIL